MDKDKLLETLKTLTRDIREGRIATASIKLATKDGMIYWGAEFNVTYRPLEMSALAQSDPADIFFSPERQAV